MKTSLKGKTGVTLVALVVTVIILLILAAITINLTIGENGIITTARQAGKNYQEAAENEQAMLAEFWSETEGTIISSESAQNSVGKGTALESQILSGRTAYVQGNLVVGTMADFSNTRVNIAKESEISKEDEYAYVNVPEAGYYDTSSQIGIAIEGLTSIIDTNRDWKLVLSVQIKWAYRGADRYWVYPGKIGSQSVEVTCVEGVCNVLECDYAYLRGVMESSAGDDVAVSISSVSITSFEYLN